MSHDDIDTLDVLDDEDFHEDGHSIIIDEPEKLVISKKMRQGLRRMIDDVLEEQRLRAVLSGYEDALQNMDIMLDNTVVD